MKFKFITCSSNTNQPNHAHTYQGVAALPRGIHRLTSPLGFVPSRAPCGPPINFSRTSPTVLTDEKFGPTTERIESLYEKKKQTPKDSTRACFCMS